MCETNGYHCITYLHKTKKKRMEMHCEMTTRNIEYTNTKRDGNISKKNVQRKNILKKRKKKRRNVKMNNILILCGIIIKNTKMHT